MFSSNNSQVANDVKYIEEYFSTFLYQGTGASNTINNGIDLSTKGGLVWTKSRNLVEDHNLFDTARGVRTTLNSNTTAAQYQADPTYFLTSFNSNGFTMGLGDGNANGYNYTSWSFAKTPKFFDVVTYTGNATAGRTISHNLGSTPGCIIVKQTGGGGSGGVNNWFVYHQSLGATQAIILESTGAAFTSSSPWNNTAPTSTVFSVGGTSDCNDSGGTYVAYLFAHNAGGFGLTGTDNVISCGSFTTDGSGNATVNLGYEPQWIMVKSSSNADNWKIGDNMRGWTVSTDVKTLLPNLSNAEGSSSNPLLTNTGFQYVGDNASRTFIYIAIRRGPMKVPTDATKVLNISSATAGTSHYVGFPPDLVLNKDQASGSYPFNWGSRLQGNDKRLQSATTNGELTGTGYWKFDDKTNYFTNTVTATGYDWSFKRAPSFFDVVCFKGSGTTPQNHNLGVAPEMMIVKMRDLNDWWYVYHKDIGTGFGLQLQSTAAKDSGAAIWNNTAPTSTQFVAAIGSSYTNVAYLFATCPGVQYINSYVGDGTTGRTINCGFTGGARFVCIKANSTTGSWWTFDSARGIVTNNDPALQLNSTAAEVTSADAIDTASSGFIVNQEATCSLNASGVTYLVWAIA